ncbi:UPF0175 family protein [archaeon]|nr:UPF0175 family protein [archaeon]
MSEAIGVRFDEDFLKKLEKLSSIEHSDRSTLIRKFSYLGYKEYMKQSAARDYLEGRVTISKAAMLAGITLWEMEQYLVSAGFVSKYSLKDLEEELKLLA